MTIAVIIPAYNEEKTVSNVVRDFKKELPKAQIYVFDNNSTDNTAKLAKKAGAKVIPVIKKGKGNVMQYAFEHIKTDFYVIVDADDTYPAEKVHELLKPVQEYKYSMMVGSRMGSFKKEKKSFLHNVGNKIILIAMHLILRGTSCLSVVLNLVQSHHWILS